MKEIFAGGGLSAAWYDRMYPGDLAGTSVAGDRACYLASARRARGPVLELGCGTGRIALPLLRAGVAYTGLDASPAMLRLARAKAAALGLGARAAWVRADMTRFALRRRFALILIPFRAFQHLTTVRRQLDCLVRCRRHLATGGKLMVDLFDPNLESCLPERRRAVRPPSRRASVYRDAAAGRTLRIEYLSRRNDPLRQVFREVWRFTLRDFGGRVLRRELNTVTLRWTYRFEMEHLLHRAGFRRPQCRGSFRGGPVRYGVEQVWTACR